MFRVKHPYDPQNTDELLLAVGDDVTNVRDVGNGWVVGHNRTTGNTGLCPKDFLQERSRMSRKQRMSRMKTRMSTIYTNLTHLPKPACDENNIPFTVISPEVADDKHDSKQYILPDARTRSQKCTRAAIGVLVGVLSGAITFAALTLSYGYSFVIAAAISGGITLVMCVFLIFSPHARCVAAMMSISVFTSQGRSAFLSLIPGLLLAGPIMNMHGNINEAATSAACIAEVLLNQSLAIHRQLLEPVTLQQQNLETAAKFIETKTVDIKSSFSTLRSVIKDIDDSDNKQSGFNGTKVCTRHLYSLYKECERRITDNVKACKDAVDSSNYRDPVPTLRPSNGSWPANLSFFKKKCRESVCDAADPVVTCNFLNSSKICDVTGEILTNKNIRTVTQSMNDLDNLISFRLNSSSIIDVRGNTSIDPIKRVRELKETLQKHLDTTILVFSILNKILFLYIIYVFVKACTYLRRYLGKIKFDNIYINDQFRYLDKHIRSKEEEKAVLPLKKEETKKYIDSSSPRQCPVETAKCRMAFSLVLLHTLMASIVVLMDFALYYVLKVITENGDVDFLVTGGVWLEVNVDGSGAFADIFRAVVEGISVSKEFQDVLNFKQCLPNATEPSLKSVYSIAALYALAMIFALMQAYGLRLRHKIVGFFFPEREAERVHYLYRHILLKRTVRAEEAKKVNLLADKWSVFCRDTDKDSTVK